MDQKKAGPWRTVLHETLDRYREQQDHGGDMAEAGEELARAVERLLIPHPCSPSRETLLRGEVQLTDYAAGEGLPLDDLP